MFRIRFYCFSLLLQILMVRISALPNPKLSADVALMELNSHKLLNTLKEWHKKGFLVRLILNAPASRNPGALTDQLPEPIPVRFTESNDHYAEFVVLDRQRAWLQPDSMDDSGLRSKIRLEKPTATQLSGRFVEIWKSLSPQRGRQLRQALRHSLENQTVVPSDRPESAVLDSNSGPFVGSATGEVYYRRESSAVSRIKKENRVYFQTEEEARQAGRRRSARF